MTEEHIRFLTDTAKGYRHPIGFVREPSVSEPDRCFVYIIFMTDEKSKDMAMIANGNADDTFTDMETMKVYTMEDILKSSPDCNKAKRESFRNKIYCDGSNSFKCRHCIMFIHNCDRTYEEIMKVSTGEEWFAKGRTSWDDELNEKGKNK